LTPHSKTRVVTSLETYNALQSNFDDSECDDNGFAALVESHKNPIFALLSTTARLVRYATQTGKDS